MSGGNVRMGGEFTSIAGRLRGPGYLQGQWRLTDWWLILGWPDADEGYVLEQTTTIADGIVGGHP